MRTVSLMLTALLASALAACSSGTSTSTSTTTAASPMAPAKAPKTMAKATNGGPVYSTNCSTCHGANGQGGAGPALAKNTVVMGDPAKLIHIVKDGLTVPTKINGQTYSGTMPAWKGTLSGADIAAVISYIRSSWGNKASAVTTAQVNAAP